MALPKVYFAWRARVKAQCCGWSQGCYSELPSWLVFFWVFGWSPYAFNPPFTLSMLCFFNWFVDFCFPHACLHASVLCVHLEVGLTCLRSFTSCLVHTTQLEYELSKNDLYYSLLSCIDTLLGFTELSTVWDSYRLQGCGGGGRRGRGNPIVVRGIWPQEVPKEGSWNGSEMAKVKALSNGMCFQCQWSLHLPKCVPICGCSISEFCHYRPNRK